MACGRMPISWRNSTSWMALSCMQITHSGQTCPQLHGDMHACISRDMQTHHPKHQAVYVHASRHCANSKPCEVEFPADMTEASSSNPVTAARPAVRRAVGAPRLLPAMRSPALGLRP